MKECHPDTDFTIRKIALGSTRQIGEQSFDCDICQTAFRKRTLLNQHKLKVHEVVIESDYGCDQCGIKCANLPGLKAHMRGHVAKRFLCGSCNKSFLVLSQLKDHVDRGICLLENRKCKICDKVYSDRIRLELHLRTHTNLKPFPCSVCEKAFTQKRSLKEHLLTHDTVRHFECQHCQKKFVQKNHLKYHLASQHAETTNSSQLKHQCTVCGKVFPFPYQLRKHVTVHGSTTSKQLQARFQCRLCAIWFSSPALLQVHTEQCCSKLQEGVVLDRVECREGGEVVWREEQGGQGGGEHQLHLVSVDTIQGYTAGIKINFENCPNPP